MNRIVVTSEYADILKPCVELIASTLGPYGANVHFYAGSSGGPLTYRDGYQVAKNFQPLDDPTANIMSRLRSRAKMTVDKAGDSTTSTIILLDAIYRGGREILKDNPEISPRLLASSIRKAAMKVVARMSEKYLIEIDTMEKLRSVTTISAGNNPVIGKLVGDLVWSIGKTGVIILEPGEGTSVECEKLEGFHLEGGAYHESYVAGKGSTTIIEKPYVLLIDEARDYDAIKIALSAWHELFQRDGSPLVVVSRHLEGSALAALVRRLFAGDRTQAPIYAVKVDIAAGANADDLQAITGGDHFGRHNGISMKEFDTKQALKHFGRAEKVVINMKRSVFYGEKVEERISMREAQLEELRNATGMGEAQKELIDKRIAAMRSNVGRIVFPVTTQGESTNLYEILQDAYLAAQSALRDGATLGCGLGLANAAYDCDSLGNSITEGPVYSACHQVFIRLLRNGGIGEDMADKLLVALIDDVKHKGKVINLNQSALVDMLEDHLPEFVDPVNAGIVDAFGAVSAAILNAADEAAEWLETKFVVLPQ